MSPQELYLLASIFCHVVLITGQTKDSENLCTFRKTCGECLQTPRCVWCSTTTFDLTSSLIRCVPREKLLREGDSWCNKSDVIDDDSEMTILRDLPLSSIKGKEPVQVQPQQIKLRLRRGEEYRIALKYTQAEDYPVDLYYLMDLSYSMREHRNRLSKLGFEIAEAIRKLTSNFRLGFGSFVDKVTLPMTFMEPSKLAKPCGNTLSCAPPYDYKHKMSLTENIALFKSHVMDAPLSGNSDSPEGGFDALMQAMVCAEKIGWRQKARRLIVFSTDARFHFAGDGRLAGIVEPNDGLCHLDENGFYSKSLDQDYPSISQIHKKSQELNMNIIFAIASNTNENIYKIYEMLSKTVSGSSVGSIKGNSQRIVQLISSEYEKLVDSVILVDNKPSLIDVKYFSRCLNSSGELIERRECSGLRVGNVVEFEIVLKAVECPGDPKERTKSLEIKPRGINESLTIDIEIICDCPCEREDHPEYQQNSTQCESQGTLNCGVCTCNEGFFGKQCKCEGHAFGTLGENITEDCKPINATKDCNGRGTCDCGVCDCMKRPLFYGPYCECDDFSCKRSGGEVCGGRGKCKCGRCNCLPGWSGETCDCKETNSTCIPPSTMTMTSGSEGDPKICSGRGDCVCGSCECHEKNNIRYSGQYCEECPTCPGKKCEELKNCVECMAYGTGPFAKKGKCDTCVHEITLVEVVKEDPEKDRESDAHICRTPGDGGCSFAFKYEYYRKGRSGDIKIFKILAQKERDCPRPINILGVALGVIVSTILLGLLTILIWKVLTTIHDKREYEKFERERALARWDRGDNPLFKQATSTFDNPTFSVNT